MELFNQKVEVTFVDDATGGAFATAVMEAVDLPETFAIRTSLRLGDSDWSVVHAEPRTRAECAKAGALTLRLRKIDAMPAEEIAFSQLDITENIDDNQNLAKDEWIATTPLNARIPNPESAGLPARGADADEVYRAALAMSAIRESIALPDDGVYCPICHIASVDLAKLRTPCPQCGRELLKFGWT